MKCLDLLSTQPHIPSKLAVRKVGLKLEFSLVTGELPPNAALVGNFKPRLIQPDEKFWISLPRANSTFEQVPITGRECCEAFLYEISKLLQEQGRKVGTDTVLRFSEPPFPSPNDRKAYQDTVRKAAKQASLGSAISFFREPDAVFEYFRLLQRKIPARGSSLNVLVLDFGGGTCNVSVVSTTRQGELWKRYIAAPIAAEASKAGGLYIDQQLLTQALLAANLKHLYSTGAQPEERRAYQAWQERHMVEAEHLKRRVSETQVAHRLTVQLDGKLAEFAGGERDLLIELDPQRLRDIVAKHWNDRGIRTAIDNVLAQMHSKLVQTARRKNVPNDPKPLVTHVLIAGGSSQLPGFFDHVRQYFAPHTPEFIQVGSDYPYVVAVGTGLNHLALNRALVDERAPQPLPTEVQGQARSAEEEPVRSTDSTFIGAFQDDLCLFWHPPEETEPQLLVDSHISPLELLSKAKYQHVKLPGRRHDGFRHVRDQRYGYQIVYRNDQEAWVGLSGQRLNVDGHHLRFPPTMGNKQVQVKTSMLGEPGLSLEMVLQVLSPKDNKPMSERRIPFLSNEVPESTSTAPVPAPSALPGKAPKAPVKAPAMSVQDGKLSTKALDVLCIDFGTTNTTLIDLSQASELTLNQFTGTSLPEPLTTIRLEPVQVIRIPAADPATPMAPPATRPAPSAPPLAARPRTVEPTPPPPVVMPMAAEPTATLKHTTRASPESPQTTANLQAVASPQATVPMESAKLRDATPRLRSGRPFTGSEREFIQHLDKTCRDAGFEFPQELMETLYLSLKVRPFVVLAGPSGVGKSALAQLMFEACGGSLDTQDALRLAVEAHWTDSRFLFGRRDARGIFQPTPLYQMLREASPDRLYHVLLDEMNLAHVEYYFAQLLSAMESDGLLCIHEDDTGGVPLRMPVAHKVPLLRLYGTINVDESTQVLSDKVIDRVNVIEVEAVPPKERISAEVKRERPPPAFHLPLEKLREWHHVQGQLDVPVEIREIWDVMARREPQPQSEQGSRLPQQARLSIPLGHRIIQDIALFVHYAERLGGTVQRKDAIDLQVKQRILPKIRGDVRLQEMLAELAQVLAKHQLHRSARRLDWMRQQLQFDQFVTFWA